MRLFVALDLDASGKVELEKTQRKLDSFGRTVRWVKPEQMHLTLVFLGEVDDSRAPEICDAVKMAAGEAAPFEMTLSGAGCFPKRGAVRVVWVGIDEPSGILIRLQDMCADALDAIGFPKEERPFSPHLTLGRVKDDRTRGELRNAVDDLDVNEVVQTVKAIRVVQSELRPQGPLYTTVAEYPLGG